MADMVTLSSWHRQYIPGFHTTSYFSYVRVYVKVPSFKRYVEPPCLGSPLHNFAILLLINLTGMVASPETGSNLKHWDRLVLSET